MRAFLSCIMYQWPGFGVGRKTIQEQESGSGRSTWFRLYCILLILYGGSHLFVALLLNMPWLRRQMEKCSHFGPVPFLNWVHQVLLPQQLLYVFWCEDVNAVRSRPEV